MAELELDLGDSGIGEEELRRHSATLREGLASLDTSPNGEFLRVTHRRDLLREIRTVCRERPRGITDVVQLGIGGSSLGARALCAALLPPLHNEQVRPPGLRCHFPDNIDPESFGALLEALDPKRTLVHVVSKSGGTLETAAQLHALVHVFRQAARAAPLSRRFVATTGEQGPLRDFASQEGIPILQFPRDVAGRYSVFTASGLLVPALCGVPVARVLAGARRMEARCRAEASLGPAGQLAVLHCQHDRVHRRPIHVEMIYADALQPTGDWFRQIWAESLGKKGGGPTPVVARGTTDQHSQVQLYVEGPDDKLYTLLRVERFRNSVRLPRSARPREISGRGFAAIFDAEARGTREALVASGRPVAEIRLPKITPESVGELLLMKQLQTALSGALYRVDPFTQPGVEAGKIAAMRILSS